MRKILYFVAALVVIAGIASMSSCKKDKAEVAKVNQDSIDNLALTDSLATIRAEKDTLAALMMEVSDGMNQILDMQNQMSVENLNSDSPDKKIQLRNNILAIQQGIVEQKQRVAQLEKRLKQSTNYSDAMKKQIASLKQQLDHQESIINSLTAQLQAAHVTIKNLNTKVDSLNTENAHVTSAYNSASARAQEETQRANNLVNEMNVCYYVVGSKKELKRQKIIETGFLKKTRVMEGDFTQSYFTKADKRTLNRIALHSKKAEIMSRHPSGSYVIEDEGGQKVLKITNPSRFWELSNYLVVKIK
jgi:chromosome segregation ATPase